MSSNGHFRADIAAVVRIPTPPSHHPVMTFYQRRLPHWHPPGRALFLTWRLHGSLPGNRFPPANSPSAAKAFLYMDRYLDEARTGPMWLKNPEIAQMTAEAFHHAEQKLRLFDLHAWVLMSNHVHLLATPHVPAAQLTQSLKGHTARQANKLLNRTGQPFWHAESYDHWIRDDAQFQRVNSYIELNPVRAGLVTAPEFHPYSSAHR